MYIKPEKVQTIKELHQESQDMLLKVVAGRVDNNLPAPITLKDASCLIAKVIDNNTRILFILNEAEKS